MALLAVLRGLAAARFALAFGMGVTAGGVAAVGAVVCATSWATAGGVVVATGSAWAAWGDVRSPYTGLPNCN